MKIRYLAILFVYTLLSCNVEAENKNFVKIYSMPLYPGLPTFENVDVFDLGCQEIKYYRKELNEDDLTLVDSTHFKYVSENSFLIEKFSASGELVSSHLISKEINDGKLVKLNVVDIGTDESINHKDLFYNSNLVNIDVYYKGKLQEKYEYILDEEGKIVSIKNSTLSPFSGNWKDSYIFKYIYDEERISRITKEEVIFEIKYVDEMTMIITDNYSRNTVEFNKNNSISQEKIEYNPGQERKLKVIDYQYFENKISAIEINNIRSDGVTSSVKYVFTY